MKFFIHYRPVHTKRYNHYTGDLVKITTEDVTLEGWNKRRCNRSQSVYNRLTRMLKSAGMDDEMTYPLDSGRSVRDLVKYMDQWEAKDDH